MPTGDGGVVSRDRLAEPDAVLALVFEIAGS
jgi:hypothetical protein